MTKDSGANKLYTHQRFVFMTLDPVHIGTGGYRLGLVDNAIVREPGTGIPKIPGTGLMGAARSYAAMRYGNTDAAGQHKNYKDKEIKRKCPIIYTFGTASESDEGHAGTVSISDARMLLFPVHSMAGPVWVSTKEALTEAGFTVAGGDVEKENILTSLDWGKPNLNLGWLLLTVKKGLNIAPPAQLNNAQEWNAIKDRVAIVSQKLLSQVINSNLEVRTSVAINPETGAAEDKALFTYEAIPRAAWLWCDVVENDYRKKDSSNSFPETEKQCKIENGKEGKKYLHNQGEPLGETWKRPLDVVKAGFGLIEYLGVGGMGTRGFGRMRLIKDWEVQKL